MRGGLNVSFKYDKLKQDFIKYFGEELLNEEEIIKTYQNAVDVVCSEYLGIESIPVVFDSLIDEVARYDFKLVAIILNRKYKNDYVELLDSTLHELEHHWQHIYISNFDTPKAKRWKEEFNHYDKYNAYQEVEIDAYAFAQVIGHCEFGINYKCEDQTLQMLVEEYINSKKILSDN